MSSARSRSRSRSRSTNSVYSNAEEVDTNEMLRDVQEHGIGNHNPRLTHYIPLKRNFRTPTKTRKAYSPPSTPRKRKAVHWDPEIRITPTRKNRASVVAPGAPKKVARSRHRA